MGSKHRARLRIANWRSRPRILVILALVVGFALVFSGGALAVDTEGLFELDGNAVAGSAAGDDWDNLDDGTGDPNNDDSAIESDFVTDDFEDPDNDHIFAKNSKDPLDITAWWWKFGEPEDKNDIEHAYTALYEDPVSGDSILYFGIDRMSNSGAASLGLWFLQAEVDQPDNGAVNKEFSGAHTAGDILVQTDFTVGGTISRLDVYMWDCDGFFTSVALCLAAFDPAPELVSGDLWRISEEADCSFDHTLACGEVNTGVVAAPWAYEFKCSGNNKPVGLPPLGCDGVSGVTPLTVFPVATFFEGGLNLTAALGGQAVCLATMVAESRSSASETSTLDDKAMGSLDICGDIVATKYKDVATFGSRQPLGADGVLGGNDDEVGLAGWTIFIDENGDGLLQAADEVSGVTGANGTFTFEDLRPGNYSICEVTKLNWDRTDPSTTLPCKTVSPGDPATPVAFGNTPLSNFDVRFTDLTGFTNATIGCVVQGTTTPPIGTSSSSQTQPETTLTATGQRIGTYVCTITITDP